MAALDFISAQPTIPKGLSPQDPMTKILLLSNAINALGKTFSAASGNPRSIAVGQNADQTLQQAATAQLMKKFLQPQAQTQAQPSLLGSTTTAPGPLYPGGVPAVPDLNNPTVIAAASTPQISAQTPTQTPPLDPALLSILPTDQQGMLMNSVLASERAKTELANTAFQQQLALQENARANQGMAASAAERVYQHTQDTQQNVRADTQVGMEKERLALEKQKANEPTRMIVGNELVQIGSDGVPKVVYNGKPDEVLHEGADGIIYSINPKTKTSTPVAGMPARQPTARPQSISPGEQKMLKDSLLAQRPDIRKAAMDAISQDAGGDVARIKELMQALEPKTIVDAFGNNVDIYPNSQHILDLAAKTNPSLVQSFLSQERAAQQSFNTGATPADAINQALSVGAPQQSADTSKISLPGTPASQVNTDPDVQKALTTLKTTKDPHVRALILIGLQKRGVNTNGL